MCARMHTTDLHTYMQHNTYVHTQTHNHAHIQSRKHTCAHTHVHTYMYTTTKADIAPRTHTIYMAARYPCTTRGRWPMHNLHAFGHITCTSWYHATSYHDCVHNTSMHVHMHAHARAAPCHKHLACMTHSYSTPRQQSRACARATHHQHTYQLKLTKDKAP